MNITLRQIRYFLAVAESASVSSAGRDLHISQSAVTTAVHELEQTLGIALFKRSPRGVSLTPDGHQFMIHARRIMASVAEAGQAVRSRRKGSAGELTIGVTSLVAGYYLADLLGRYRRVFSEVDVDVVEDEQRFLEHHIVNGEVDVAIMMINALTRQDALITEVLTRSANRLWLPVNHALCEPAEVSLADIAELPLITLTADRLDEILGNLWRRAGMLPRTVLRTSSVEAVRSLVGSGAGIAVLPDFAYRPWSLEWDRVEARGLRDDLPTVDIALVWRRGSPVSWPTQEFIETARDQSRAKARHAGLRH